MNVLYYEFTPKRSFIKSINTRYYSVVYTAASQPTQSDILPVELLSTEMHTHYHIQNIRNHNYLIFSLQKQRKLHVRVIKGVIVLLCKQKVRSMSTSGILLSLEPFWWSDGVASGAIGDTPNAVISTLKVTDT